MASKREKCRETVSVLNPFPSSQTSEYQLLQISAKIFISSRHSCPEIQRRRFYSHSMAPFSLHTMEIILLTLLEIVSDPVTKLVSQLGSVNEKVLLLPFQSKTNSNPKHIFPFQLLYSSLSWGNSIVYWLLIFKWNSICFISAYSQSFQWNKE